MWALEIRQKIGISISGDIIKLYLYICMNYESRKAKITENILYYVTLSDQLSLKSRTAQSSINYCDWRWVIVHAKIRQMITLENLDLLFQGNVLDYTVNLFGELPWFFTCFRKLTKCPSANYILLVLSGMACVIVRIAGSFAWSSDQSLWSTPDGPDNAI